MTDFKFNDFLQGRVMIHCHTPKEAEILLGIISNCPTVNCWCDGDPISSRETAWDTFKDETCYEIEQGVQFNTLAINTSTGTIKSVISFADMFFI